MSPESGGHVALQGTEYCDRILTWGGRKVTELVEEAGDTPLYVYDRNKMRSRVAELRSLMPQALRLHYAVKANPMPAVVQYMASLLDGLDVASAGELKVALDCHVDPKDVSFAGPGKRDFELRYAAGSGITITLESEGEMHRLARIGAEIGRRPAVAIRVNPPFELQGSGVKMGGRPSPFGVDAERVPGMVAELLALDLDFRGLQVFSGSQNLRAEAIGESLNKTVGLVIELSAPLGLDGKFVNLGGGLGIPYFPRERNVDLATVADAVQSAVGALRAALGEVEVIMEFGRYLVGEAGIYVTRVVDIKESRGRRFVVCDGGLHHHLAASGNFGQVVRKNYPIAAVTLTDERESITVVGPLCTPLDLLGDRVMLSRLEVGSLVAILQSGAYGRTASPQGFLSHPSCGEIVC
jgi:diaminopimelate decarboxylase